LSASFLNSIHFLSALSKKKENVILNQLTLLIEVIDMILMNKRFVEMSDKDVIEYHCTHFALNPTKD